VDILEEIFLIARLPADMYALLSGAQCPESKPMCFCSTSSFKWLSVYSL